MKKKKIYIAGHDGMVGSNLILYLKEQGYSNLIFRNYNELDLIDTNRTNLFFKEEKPDIVILAAGKVGGILANTTFPAEFIYQNMMIELNVIHAAHQNKVEKLIFFGTSSMYPRNAIQPIREEALLTGEFEKTNEPYSIAKVAGIKLCQYYHSEYGDNFFSIMPANLYGPFDHFEADKSHVVPALIYKFLQAKNNNTQNLELWGTGKPLRELLFAPDLARIMDFLIKNINAADIYNQNIATLNIGSGFEVSIEELANSIKKIVGFNGEIIFNSDKPDGIMRKVLDCSRLTEFGWNDFTNIELGLDTTINWYLKNSK